MPTNLSFGMQVKNVHVKSCGEINTLALQWVITEKTAGNVNIKSLSVNCY